MTNFYELVNVKVRDAFDLTTVEEVIWESIALTHPDASNVRVFASFYCCDTPKLSCEETNRRARSLGRLLANKMPTLAQVAMRSYESGNRGKSNQLFRAVKGKKRLEYCLSILEMLIS